MASYYVYLATDDEDPEEGDEHSDWIRFICKTATMGFICNNDKEDMVDHESFEIKIGEMEFTCMLNDAIFTRVETSSSGETCWNDFVEFVGSNALSTGSKIYLWIKMNMVDATDWIQFFDNDGNMQDYMQCRIKQFRFNLDPTKGWAKGVLLLEEEWGS